MLALPGHQRTTRMPTMRATAGRSQAYSEFASPSAAAGAEGESDHLVHAMTAVLARQRPGSTAEALRMLRRGYPDIPLALRIAAMRAGAK
jgi:hypothetical protein